MALPYNTKIKITALPTEDDLTTRPKESTIYCNDPEIRLSHRTLTIKAEGVNLQEYNVINLEIQTYEVGMFSMLDSLFSGKEQK